MALCQASEERIHTQTSVRMATQVQPGRKDSRNRVVVGRWLSLLVPTPVPRIPDAHPGPMTTQTLIM